MARYYVIPMPWWWEYIVWLSLALTLYSIFKFFLWIEGGGVDRYLTRVFANKATTKNPIDLLVLRLAYEIDLIEKMLSE